MEKSQKYYYHKIPLAESLKIQDETTKQEKPPLFVGIIDSSGSMSSAWTHVANNYNVLIDDLSTPNKITYCFDTSIHNVPNNKLQQNINAHGGGGTDIYLPMKKLDEIITDTDADVEIKVVFVSDGGDNTYYDRLGEQLAKLKGARDRNVSFMCLGVESGFPTKTSMSLRELFHRGDSSIPSIFLIEYSSDKAFFNKFQTLKKFCAVKSVLTVEPPQKIFPWEAPVSEIIENTWIMSTDKSIKVNGNEFVYKSEDFSVESICDIFRSWSQKLQLDSINKKITFPQAKEFATSCLGLIDNITEDIKASQGIDIKSNKTKEGSDFLTKVLNLQVMRTSQKINGYITAVEDIKNGKDLSTLSEFEAAKIIGLGTIVGKAQQRALALKFMTPEKLKECVKEFIEVLDSIEIKETSGFENSHISEGNYNKLFRDESFKAGIQQLESPLDFLDVFPIYGTGLVVKRPDGANTDASKVTVTSYLKKGVLDSSTFDFATYKLDIEEGEEKLGCNCVCPTLSPEDQYLAPLFNTDLMRYAMSYNVTQELDAINNSSWITILGDLFVHAVKNKDEILIKRVASTLTAMKNEKDFQPIYEGVETNDSVVYSQFKSEGLFYATMYLFATKEGSEPEEKVEYVQKIWLKYFGQRLASESITAFVSTEAVGNLKAGVLANYSPEKLTEKFYTSKELVRHIRENLVQEMESVAGEQQASGLVLLPSGFTSDVNKFISYAFIKQLAIYINNSKLDDSHTFNYLAHCLKYTNNSLNQELVENINESKEFLSSNLNSGQDQKLKKRIMYQCMDDLKRQYFAHFKQLHWNIKPIEMGELQEICGQKNIDINELDYENDSKMVRNACMARECPHFLLPKTKTKLRNHMGGWQGKCPRAFHLYVSENSGKSDEDIYNGFMNERGKNGAEDFGMTKEKVLDYIKQLKTGY